MKVKLFAVLLLAGAVSISFATDVQKRGNKAVERVNDKAVANVTTLNAIQRPSDLPGTIDGSRNPELIPDHVAYLTLLRMLSHHRTEAEKNSIRVYVEQVMGLGKQKTEGGDVDALLAAAEDFHHRVSVLDAQAKEIKDRTWPNPSAEAMAQLTSLQGQKEALVAEIVASLPRHLSAAGVTKVRQHVSEHVKRNTRLTPTPATLPGGNGWQHGGHN